MPPYEHTRANFQWYQGFLGGPLASRAKHPYTWIMKLFYALEFDDATRDSLVGLQKDIRPYCQKGFFTRSTNLHLTLCFLGEVEGQVLTILKEILLSLESPPLRIKFNQLGQFHKRKGDILWLGIEDNRELEALQAKLANKLRANDFFLDDQHFHPHVTLARGVRSKKFPTIENFEVLCERVTLMHSHRRQDILTYIPLFTKQLDQAFTL